MMNRKEACNVLGLEEKEIHSDETIKQSYRKLALRYHPDKQAKATPEEQKEAAKKFRQANEAYDFLLNPEAKHEGEAEFSPSWFNIINSELVAASKTSLAMPDQHKPTLHEFFRSLDKRLLQFKIQLAKAKASERIAEFEGLSLGKQKSNKEYTLRCLEAAHQISCLLQAHIKTGDESHWRITAEKRKLQLAYRLMSEFRKFGLNLLLIIKDANTFNLQLILLDHLAFLRNPLQNFKSTEDRYHLTLLDEVSERIRDYHNQMLTSVDTYHEAETRYGGNISARLCEASNDCATIYTELDSNKLSALGLFALKETLVALKEKINRTKEYILVDCHYPDNVDIYNPKKDRRAHQYGIRGHLRKTFIFSMLDFNMVVERFNTKHSGPSLEGFSEIGYATRAEYDTEAVEMLGTARQNHLPAAQFPLTGKKFLDLNNGAKKVDKALMLKGPSSSSEMKTEDTLEERDSIQALPEVKEQTADLPLEVSENSLALSKIPNQVLVSESALSQPNSRVEVKDEDEGGQLVEYENLNSLDERLPSKAPEAPLELAPQEAARVEFCDQIELTIFGIHDRFAPIIQKLVKEDKLADRTVFRALNMLSYLRKLDQAVVQYNEVNPPQPKTCFSMFWRNEGQERKQWLLRAVNHLNAKLSNVHDAENHEEEFSKLVKKVEDIISGKDYHLFHTKRTHGLDSILKTMRFTQVITTDQMTAAFENYARYKGSFFRNLKGMSHSSFSASQSLRAATTPEAKFKAVEQYARENPDKAFANALSQAIPALTSIRLK